MSAIGVAQNLEVNVRRMLAARCFYGAARRGHFLGAALAIAMALAAPLVLLFAPDLGPTLGALAGAWIFASRLVLEPFKRGRQFKGAAAQELFDCSVLGLPWNDALLRRVPEEEVRRASGSMKPADKVRDWYPTDGDAPWPSSALICQRSNAVWGRRQHAAYGIVLAGAAVAWALIGLAVAVRGISAAWAWMASEIDEFHQRGI